MKSERAQLGSHGVERIVFSTALGIGVVILVVVTARVLLVLFAGVLFAIVLRTAAVWVARWSRLPVGAAIGLLIAIGAAATVLLVVLFGARIEEQLNALWRQLPGAVEHAMDIVRRTGAPHPKPGGVAPALAPPTDPKSIAGPMLAAIGGSIEVVSGLVVMFFVGVYGAVQPELYVRAVLSLTPSRHRARMASALTRAGSELGRWLIGRLVAMIFVGVTTTIAFHVLDLPLAGLLGAFAGLLTFVEYAGALLSAIPPILLALAKSPVTALWVAILYTVLHAIEGYVLTPLLARVAVRLPPALTLAAQVLFAVLVGPLGLTFSTPLLVVATSAAKAWREPADERGTRRPQATSSDSS